MDKKTGLSLGIVLLLTSLSYLNSIGASFQYDDFHTTVMNSNIRYLSNIPGFFVDGRMDSSVAAGGYRPLVTTTLALDYAVSGLDTWSYHVSNIAFHLAAVTALFFLTRALLAGTGAGQGHALLAAVLFGLHPAHTGAVTYIIARSAVLCTLFYLLAFLSYVRCRRWGGRAWLIAGPAFFALALLSKEVAVTLPLMILLYEGIVLRPGYARVLRYASPYLVIDALYLSLRHAQLSSSGVAMLQTGGAPLFSGPAVLGGYLRLFQFPINLNFFHTNVPPGHLFLPYFPAHAALALLFAGLAVYLWRAYPSGAFCAAWFFVALIPETFSNLRDGMAEHRLYLPSAGLVMLLSLAAARLPAALPKKALWALAAVVSACFLLLVVGRNRVYHDQVTLWRDTVAKSPGSAIAYSQLGAVYAEAGRHTEAAQALTRALCISRCFSGSNLCYLDLGNSLTSMGKDEMALKAYEEGLRLYPCDTALVACMCGQCARMGRQREGLPYIRAALRLRPGNVYLASLLKEAEPAAAKGAPGKYTLAK